MFLDWENQHCENDYTTQSNLQIQCNLYQITNGIFFFNLFLAVLGVHFCPRAFSSWGNQGPLFIMVRGPHTIAASLVAEQHLSFLSSVSYSFLHTGLLSP